MPLVLSMREGEDFFVGDTRFVVESIVDDANFQIRRSDDGKVFEIKDSVASEIEDDVFVSAGDHMLVARVAIEAPQEVLVLRGDKRRNPPKKFQKGFERTGRAV